MYVRKEPQAVSFEKVGIKGKIFPALDLINSTNVVLIDTESGHETTIIEHKSDFIYYILAGSGYFLINDTKEICSQGDLVVVPLGTKFIYKGKLKMLLITTPPWQEEQEETL